VLTEKSGNQTAVKRAASVLEQNHVHNARGLATKKKSSRNYLRHQTKEFTSISPKSVTDIKDFNYAQKLGTSFVVHLTLSEGLLQITAMRRE
jgi:methylphosphotriester-DNA--protein-cysteine methyltransferase